jgi:hypothetical protein
MLCDRDPLCPLLLQYILDAVRIAASQQRDPQAELEPGAFAFRRLGGGRLGLHARIIPDRGQPEQGNVATAAIPNRSGGWTRPTPSRLPSRRAAQGWLNSDAGQGGERPALNRVSVPPSAPRISAHRHWPIKRKFQEIVA